MKVLRVFPRRTNATPDDDLAVVGYPGLFVPEVHEIHISVTFSWDLPEAERLERAWSVFGVPVRVGGPATGMRGEEFVSGRYLKPGYVITSRGCPNRCPHCSVPVREGRVVRELPVCEGHNVLDDNLLACSEGHIRAVFAMLKRQPNRAQFTGGLEAAILTGWHADLIADLRPETLFFAYDTPDDWYPLVRATGMLIDRGMHGHRLRCYVLIGFGNDTQEAAEQRLNAVVDLGLFPMAMLYRGKDGTTKPGWGAFARSWAGPVIVGSRVRERRNVLTERTRSALEG